MNGERFDILVKVIMAVGVLRKGGETMIVTTTPNIEGHRITEYLGVVTGEAGTGYKLFP